jgi:hypothetical protein
MERTASLAWYYWLHIHPHCWIITVPSAIRLSLFKFSQHGTKNYIPVAVAFNWWPVDHVQLVTGLSNFLNCEANWEIKSNMSLNYLLKTN